MYRDRSPTSEYVLGPQVRRACICAFRRVSIPGARARARPYRNLETGSGQKYLRHASKGSEEEPRAIESSVDGPLEIIHQTGRRVAIQYSDSEETVLHFTTDGKENLNTLHDGHLLHRSQTRWISGCLTTEFKIERAGSMVLRGSETRCPSRTGETMTVEKHIDSTAADVYLHLYMNQAEAIVSWNNYL